MKKFIVPLTVAVVASIMFAACVPAAPPEVTPPPETPPPETPSPETPPPEAPPAAPTRDIKVGLVTALSGGFAAMGEKYLAGTEVAVEQINELGGIRNLGGAKLKLFTGDDSASPEQAAAETERLLTVEKVDFVIAIWPTEMTITDVCEQYETPVICPIGNSPLTERGYEYTFRTVLTAERESAQNIDAVIKSADEAGIPRPETCFMMYISDDCSVAEAAAFKPQAEAAGIEIVGEEVVSYAQTTFVPQLIKIEAAQPDFLFSCHYTGDAIILYREMMERETYFPYGISSWGGGIEDPMFYRSLPLRAYEYGFSQETGDGVPQLRPWYPYLNEKIREKMGQNWEDSHQVASYGAIWVVKEALERVEWSEDQATFRTNLRDAIAAVDLTHDTAEKFTTPDGVTFCPAIDPTGHWDGLKFDETGQCVQDVGLISQNLGGTRWPMYPEKWRLSNSPSVVLPIPPWDER